MWILKATEIFTKKYGLNCNFGTAEVKDGIVTVTQQFYKQFFIKLGFIDITPSEIKSLKSSESPKKILIIRYGGYGDILMALPAIEALKKKYPEAILDVMFDSARKDILLNHPAISNVIEGFPQYIGLFTSLYDLVIDFSTIIPNNPEAYCKNAYDLHFAWAGLPVPLRGSEKVPSLSFTSKEEKSIDSFLKQEGIKGGIIICNFDSSSPLRSYPFNKAREVIISLAKTYPEKTFIVSGTSVGNIWNQHRFDCPKCNNDIHLTLNKEPHKEVEAPYICKCGAKINLIPFKEGLKVKEVKKDTFQVPWFKKPKNMVCYNVNIREFALLIKRAELVLCADSVPGHLAGVFNTKSLSIFSSFLGNFRLSNFSNAHWIQYGYKCGPCFKHDTHCDNASRQGKKYPLCMDSISSESIVKIAKGLIEGGQYPNEIKLGDDTGYAEGYDYHFVTSEDAKCRVCGSPTRLYARKGYFWYLHCDECNSTHVNPEPSGDYLAYMYDDPKYNTIYKTAPVIKKWSTTYAKKITKMFKKKDSSLKLLEVGSNMGYFLAAAKKNGWDTLGIEINSEAIKFCKKENLEVIQGLMGRSSVNDVIKRRGPYQGIILHQVIEHFPDYIEFIRKNITPYLEKEGFISIVIPDGDTWQGQAEWPHVNCHFTGEHMMLTGEKGIKIIAKECGYEINHFEKLPSSDIWVIFKNNNL